MTFNAHVGEHPDPRFGPTIFDCNAVAVEMTGRDARRMLNRITKTYAEAAQTYAQHKIIKVSKPPQKTAWSDDQVWEKQILPIGGFTDIKVTFDKRHGLLCLTVPDEKLEAFDQFAATLADITRVIYFKRNQAQQRK